MSDRDLYFRILKALKNASEKDDSTEDLINQLESICNWYMTEASSQIRTFQSYHQVFTIASEDFGKL